MTSTANAAIDHLVENQQAVFAKVNTALDLIDALIQPAVLDSAPSTTPPGSPADGDCYIVPASATGDWAGQDDDVAIYLSGWVFRTPKEGWEFWDRLNNKRVRFDGTDWVDAQAAEVTDLVDSTGGTTDGTLSAVSGSGADSTINDNFAELAEKQAAIITALQGAGLMG